MFRGHQHGQRPTHRLPYDGYRTVGGSEGIVGIARGANPLRSSRASEFAERPPVPGKERHMHRPGSFMQALRQQTDRLGCVAETVQNKDGIFPARELDRVRADDQTVFMARKSRMNLVLDVPRHPRTGGENDYYYADPSGERE